MHVRQSAVNAYNDTTEMSVMRVMMRQMEQHLYKPLVLRSHVGRNSNQASLFSCSVYVNNQQYQRETYLEQLVCQRHNACAQNLLVRSASSNAT